MSSAISPNKPSPNIGAIVGGAVGEFAALIAILFGIFLLWQKLKQEKKGEDAGFTFADKAELDGSGHSPYHDPSVVEMCESSSLVEAEARHGRSEVTTTNEIYEVTG